MKNKFMLRTAAGALALMLTAGAAPAMPAADALRLVTAVTAAAADETAEYGFRFNEATGEGVLSGTLPDYAGAIEGWTEAFRNGMKTVRCEPGTVMPRDCAYMFNFSDVFGNQNLLESVDLTGADFSKTERLSHCFSSAHKLKSVNFGNAEISAVKEMTGMFNSCWNLKTVTGLNVTSPYLETVSQMFMDCFILETVDLSRFHTANVKFFSEMFSDCYSLQNLDLSTLDTSSAVSFDRMFASCYALHTLDLSGLNTSGVRDMRRMFQQCRSLYQVDLSGWDTRNVGSMASMFSSCYALTKLDLSGFRTENCTDFSNMFTYCSSLRSLDLSSFTASESANMHDMLYETYGLQKLTLGSGITKIPEDACMCCAAYGWINENDPEQAAFGIRYTCNHPEFSNDGTNTYVRQEGAEIESIGMDIFRDGTFGLKVTAVLSDRISEEERQNAEFNFWFNTMFSKRGGRVSAKYDGNGRIVGTYRFKPSEMTDLFLINCGMNGEALDGIGVGFSPRQYADAIFADPVQYAKEQELVRTMMLYAGAAQRHFDTVEKLHHTDEDDAHYPYADAGVPFGGGSIQTVANFVKPEPIDGLSYYGSSIVLDAGTVQRHYFDLEGGSISDYTFTADGKTLAPQQLADSDRYYINVFSKSAAMKLYEPAEILVTKNGTAQTMSFRYSAMDYVSDSLRKGAASGTAFNVVMTLSWFADAAKAYFAN